MTTQPVQTNSSVAVAMVLASCVSLQVGAAFAMQLFPLLGAPGVTTLRLAIAALVMVIVVRPKVRGWTGTRWRSVILFGLTLGGMNGFFYAAIARIDLGVAVTIEFLGPLLLAAVLSARLKEKVWVLIAFIGVLALGYEGFLAGRHLDLLGVLYALIAAAFWAGYILTSSKVGRDIPGFSGLTMALVVATVVSLPLGLSGALQIRADPGLIPIVLVMALLASAVPYSLETATLRRLTPAVFGILMSLEPVVATVVGLFFLAQGITFIKVVAAVLVVCASAASVGRPTKDPEPTGRT